MRAAVFNGPHAIEIAERPDPVIQSPTDAIVRVTLGSPDGRSKGTETGTWATGGMPAAGPALRRSRRVAGPKAALRG
jgi:hypothetical protein